VGVHEKGKTLESPNIVFLKEQVPSMRDITKTMKPLKGKYYGRGGRPEKTQQKEKDGEGELGRSRG